MEELVSICKRIKVIQRKLVKITNKRCKKSIEKFYIQSTNLIIVIVIDIKVLKKLYADKDKEL